MTNRLVLALALAVTVGCGAHAAEGTTTTTTTTPPPTTSAGATPLCSGTCPTEGARCVDERGWSCACSLYADTPCGGAYRPTRPPELAWSCAPTDPSADRGDGCPFTLPADGTRCAPSRTCRYASDGCGYSGSDANCEGGVWRLVPFRMPPPP